MSNSSQSQYDEYLKRAYGLNSKTDAKSLYGEWAATYDRDLTTAGYASPRKAVETLRRNLTASEHEQTILDAGCGTGLVGGMLRDQVLIPGRITLDGIDLSQQMLDVAKKKGIYKNLTVTDLTGSLDIDDAAYDAVISVGTFTKGHVGPQAIRELIRVLKGGGVLVVTVHKEVFIVDHYDDLIAELASKEAVKCISRDEFGIMEGSDEGGIMLVLKKL